MIEAKDAVRALVERILVLLQNPIYFRDILEQAGEPSYRRILMAWSDVRMSHDLVRDEYGRYVLPKGD